MEQIDRFIEKLATYNAGFNVENIYKKKSKKGEIRRENLRIFLKLIKELNPSVLLVGEAPGYKGCKLTGLPFTSESIMMHENYFGVLGKDKGYQHLSKPGKLEKENTATIVWEVLSKFPKMPMIWNIFPFHTYEENNHQSNRTPDREELAVGREYLVRLMNMFEITKIGAIGRKAEIEIKSLNLKSVSLQYIRHPSFGGKIDFEDGIKKLMK